MIDDYLADLRGRLRIPPDRILAEVEDHLREGAVHHGESTAIARFGAPEVVAARFHDGVAERARVPSCASSSSSAPCCSGSSSRSTWCSRAAVAGPRDAPRARVEAPRRPSARPGGARVRCRSRSSTAGEANVSPPCGPVRSRAAPRPAPWRSTSRSSSTVSRARPPLRRVHRPRRRHGHRPRRCRRGGARAGMARHTPRRPVRAVAARPPPSRLGAVRGPRAPRRGGGLRPRRGHAHVQRRRRRPRGRHRPRRLRRPAPPPWSRPFFAALTVSYDGKAAKKRQEAAGACFGWGIQSSSYSAMTISPACSPHAGHSGSRRTLNVRNSSSSAS